MKKICSVLLAVILVIFATVPAFATISPSAETEFDIIIINTGGGKGSYTTEIIDGKKYVTLTADAKDGYEFTHWEIDGEYTIVEGSLDDEKLVIILESDCEASPYFDGIPVTPPTQNTDPVSPQTGDTHSYTFMFVGLLIALAGVTGLKIASSKK